MTKTYDPYQLDEQILRSIIREAVHHGVVTLLYPSLAGRRKPFDPPGRVQQLLEIYEQRGFDTGHDDICWAKTIVDLARQWDGCCRPEFEAHSPTRYGEEEARTVESLIYERRSIRQWTEEPVGRKDLKEIVRAGTWAATGCNLQVTRYLVLDDEAELKRIPSREFSGEKAKIITLIDTRAYDIMTHLPHRNMILDVGAAMQNMLLMAESLGLGAVWGTFNDKEIARVKVCFNLADHFRVVAYISLGYPAEEVIPPGRVLPEDAVLNW